jgi:hypothetical protein
MPDSLTAVSMMRGIAVVRASATTVLSHVQQLQISSKAQGECAAE